MATLQEVTKVPASANVTLTVLQDVVVVTRTGLPVVMVPRPVAGPTGQPVPHLVAVGLKPAPIRALVLQRARRVTPQLAVVGVRGQPVLPAVVEVRKVVPIIVSLVESKLKPVIMVLAVPTLHGQHVAQQPARNQEQILVVSRQIQKLLPVLTSLNVLLAVILPPGVPARQPVALAPKPALIAV